MTNIQRPKGNILSAFVLAVVLVLIVVLIILISVLIVILVIALIILISILVVVLLVIHNKTSIRYYAAIREGSIPSVLTLILCFENQTYDQTCYNCGSNSSSSCA